MPGQASFLSMSRMTLNGIGDVGAAPAQARARHLEVAAGGRLATLDLDAGGLHVEAAAGLVLGQDAGDVVVQDDHLVDLALPLLGEDADRGRAAADPHALLGLAVDDRGLAGLDDDRAAVVDRQLDRIAAAEREQHLAGDVAGLLGGAGQVVDAAQGQHLRAVLGGRHVADGLALHGDGRRARGRDGGRCRSSPSPRSRRRCPRRRR